VEQDNTQADNVLREALERIKSRNYSPNIHDPWAEAAAALKASPTTEPNPAWAGGLLETGARALWIVTGHSASSWDEPDDIYWKPRMEENKPLYPGLLRKIRNQALKDYLLFPALTGPLFPLTLAGNATANLVRNVWAFNIIFCGHFPAGVSTFSREECEDASRGHCYYRQLLGSANITGSRLFHVMTGNLSHQIEHHLFPDIPARRYPEIAEEVREICRRYGLDYNTGSLSRQLGSVARKICRLALPDRLTRRGTSRGAEPLVEQPVAA